MNLNNLSLMELNAQELLSIDGGKKLPKPIRDKIDDAICCIREFCIGVWEELTK